MNSPLASFELWAGLFGGLALFLFGMDVMTQALKSVGSRGPSSAHARTKPSRQSRRTSGAKGTVTA